MKLTLLDPINEKFGTVLSFGVLFIIATWSILQVMHYYALIARGIDIPLPDWTNQAAAYASAIYLSYRKGENAQIANRLSTQVDTANEINAAQG